MSQAQFVLQSGAGGTKTNAAADVNDKVTALKRATAAAPKAGLRTPLAELRSIEIFLAFFTSPFTAKKLYKFFDSFSLKFIKLNNDIYYFIKQYLFYRSYFVNNLSIIC